MRRVQESNLGLGAGAANTATEKTKRFSRKAQERRISDSSGETSGMLATSAGAGAANTASKKAKRFSRRAQERCTSEKMRRSSRKAPERCPSLSVSSGNSFFALSGATPGRSTKCLACSSRQSSAPRRAAVTQPDAGAGQGDTEEEPNCMNSRMAIKRHSQAPTPVVWKDLPKPS